MSYVPLGWQERICSTKTNLARTADRIETSAAREAVGLKTPYTIMDTKEAASKLHDVSYFTKQEGKIASSVADRDDVFALSLKDAKKLGASMGIKVSDNTKGFFVPHGDYTVVVKDNIKGAKELDGVLAHEIGVHQSLKDTIGTERYQSLMDFVSTQAKDTTSKFAQAARLANSTDPEEILGYAIQHDMLSRKSSHSLVSSFREGLKAMGFLIMLFLMNIRGLLSDLMNLETCVQKTDCQRMSRKN